MDKMADLRNTLYLSVVVVMALCFGGQTTSRKIHFNDGSAITIYGRPNSLLFDKLWDNHAAGLTSSGKFVYGRCLLIKGCDLFFYICEYEATKLRHFDTAEDFLFSNYSGYFNDDYGNGGKYCDFSNATCRNILSLVLQIGFAEGFSPSAFALGIMTAVILTATAKRKCISLAYIPLFFAGMVIVNIVVGAGVARHLWLPENRAALGALTNGCLALFLFLLSGLLFWSRAHRRKASLVEVDGFACYAEKASPQYKLAITLAGFLFGMLAALPCLAGVSDLYAAISENIVRVSGFWPRLLLLSAYNLVFLVPLFAVFAVTAWGVNLVWLSGKDSRSLRETKAVLGIIAALYGAFLLLSPNCGTLTFIFDDDSEGQKTCSMDGRMPNVFTCGVSAFLAAYDANGNVAECVAATSKMPPYQPFERIT